MREGCWRDLRSGLFLAALVISVAEASSTPAWVKARSGPFEVVSDDGRRSATQALSQFEQFRFALGTVMGKPDLRLDPPVRIVLTRSASDPALRGCKGIHLGRDRLTLCAPAEAQLDPEVLRELTRILLENNFTALPPSMESAVAAFFSTIQSNATHVTWGAPPPSPERTRDWALLHRIVTQPDYAGKARIYLHNLAGGMDRRSAVRNAFGEDATKFEADTDGYYAAGVFQPSAAPSRPLNPDHDFATTALTSDEGLLISADLLDSQSAALYRQLIGMGKHVREANEGLGLLALHDKDTPHALEFFRAALNAGSKNVVMMTAYAGLEEDDRQALKTLQDAIAIDPKYAPAHWLLGERSFEPRARLNQWKQATALAPRNYDWWSRYAQYCVEQKQFAEAGRAWVAAAHAAPDEAHRSQYLTARGQIDEQRLHAEDEERRKELEARTRDLDRLKAEARKEIAALESRANGDHVPTREAAVVDWSDINGATVSGTLDAIECSGRQYRLHVSTTSGKDLIFLVKDLSRIEFEGARVKLSCGITHSRPVSVTYKPAASGPLTGEVISLEFPR